MNDAVRVKTVQPNSFHIPKALYRIFQVNRLLIIADPLENTRKRRMEKQRKQILAICIALFVIIGMWGGFIGYRMMTREVKKPAIRLNITSPSVEIIEEVECLQEKLDQLMGESQAANNAR